jgi:hypothetical protein
MWHQILGHTMHCHTLQRMQCNMYIVIYADYHNTGTGYTAQRIGSFLLFCFSSLIFASIGAALFQ